MRRITVEILVTAAILFVCTSPAVGKIEYKDGLTHEISTIIYEDMAIMDSPSGVPTVVKALVGAGLYDVIVHGHSRFYMIGGEILDGSISMYDSSEAEISAGEMGDDPSDLFDSAKLTITGGNILGGFRMYGHAQLFVHGSDFKMDGVPVPYGPLAPHIGHLTGNLTDGGQIEGLIGVHDNAVVTLVPEPATLLLLGLGGSALLSKRRTV